MDAARELAVPLRKEPWMALAPAGSISLLANNVSSGIEPVYAFQANRKVRTADGKKISMPVNDYAWSMFRKLNGPQAPLPDYFVEAYDIDPDEQLRLQSRLQAHVDQSVSKTINVPLHASFDSYRDVFTHAHQLGLKGCTVFRTHPVDEAVLSR